MDFLFIAYLFLLFMGALIYSSLCVDLRKPYSKSFLDNTLANIDYALKAVNWYPITDYRQYVVLVIGIVLGYLLG